MVMTTLVGRSLNANACFRLSSFMSRYLTGTVRNITSKEHYCALRRTRSWKRLVWLIAHL